MSQKRARAPLTFQTDQDYTYIGMNGRPTKTHLRIYVDPTRLQDAVVVATELRDTAGGSITNTAEMLATALLPQMQEWGYGRFTLIEHYPHQGPVPDHLKSAPERFHLNYETFSEVGMTLTDNRDREGRRMFTAPTWRYISRDDVEAMIGQPFPVLRDYPRKALSSSEEDSDCSDTEGSEC